MITVVHVTQLSAKLCTSVICCYPNISLVLLGIPLFTKLHLNWNALVMYSKSHTSIHEMRLMPITLADFCL